MSKWTWAVIFLGACGGSDHAATSPVNALAGVWEVVERTYERNDSVWVEHAPGLYLFTDRHYAVQEIREGDGQRPMFDSTTTDEERLAAFDVFHAHAGTYVVEGGRLLVTPTVAKGPNTMSGTTHEYLLDWEGDGVTVTRVSQSEGERRATTLRRVGSPN